MDTQRLLDSLTSINTWWTGAEVPKKIKKSDNKRKVFYDISQSCLEDDQILAISGPRQVGKTTLIGQLIEHQIKEEHLDPKRIIYIPLDTELLSLHAEDVFFDSLKVYNEFIIGEAFESLSKRVYIYLDEIQTLSNWSTKLKSFQDIYSNIKIIISGSSQTKLYSDASEALVGRITFRILLPFKFKEFLEFHLEERSRDLDFSTVNLRKALEESIEKKDPRPFYQEIVKLKVSIMKEIPMIKKTLNSYLIKGGYPGVLTFYEDYDKALERLRTDLQLTVFKDIHRIFNTRNPSDMMSLLTLIANSSGQKCNYTSFGNAIGIDRRVVGDYISYAKLVYLVSESPYCTINHEKKIAKNNKIYIQDVGHRNALVGQMRPEILTKPESGLILQTAAFDHASRLKFCLSHHTEYEVCYWEDHSSEVDIVLDLPVVLLPLEVKSQSWKKGMKAMNRFLEENKRSEWGIIISGDELEIKENILIMPLWTFFLMC